MMASTGINKDYSKPEEGEVQTLPQIPETPVGFQKQKRIISGRARTKSKSMPWQKQWDAFRAAEANSPNRSPQTRIIYVEVEGSPDPIDNSAPQASRNNEVQNGLEHHGNDMTAHEEREEPVEETGSRSSSSGSDMNVNLGDGNTAKVDVAAAIGREVLNILNTTSQERDRLKRRKKDLMDKNRLLMEENTSLKLLLAQHGISLDGLNEFEVPQDQDPDDLSDSMSLSTGPSEGHSPPGDASAEIPSSIGVAQAPEGPTQTSEFGTPVAESSVEIHSGAPAIVPQSSVSSTQSSSSSESVMNSPSSCSRSHGTSPASSNPSTETQRNTGSEARSPVNADSGNLDKHYKHNAMEIETVTRSPSTTAQVAVQENETRKESMLLVNVRPSWRERAESILTNENAAKVLRDPVQHPASSGNESRKEVVLLSNIEVGKARKVDSNPNLENGTAKNPRTQEPLVSKDKYLKENMPPSIASTKRDGQVNPGTTLPQSTVNDVPRFCSQLAIPAKSLRKENIPPSQNELRDGRQLNINSVTNGDIAKKPSGTPDESFNQGQDVQKAKKRGGEENIDVLSTPSKRRRTEKEVNSPSKPKTLQRNLGYGSQARLPSRNGLSDDHPQALGLRELSSNVNHASQKQQRRHLEGETLQHDQKREVEIKVLELRDRLEDEVMAEAEIEHQTEALRRRLLKKAEQEIAIKANELAMQQAHELADTNTIKVEKDDGDITVDYLPRQRTKAVIAQLHNHRRQGPNMSVESRFLDDPSQALGPRELDYDEDEIRLEEDRRVQASAAMRRELKEKLRRGDYEQELYQLVKQKSAGFKCQVLYCKEIFPEQRLWLEHFEEKHQEDSNDLREKYGITSTPVCDPPQKDSVKSKMTGASSTHGSKPVNKATHHEDAFHRKNGTQELNYDEESQVDPAPKVGSNLAPRVSPSLPKKPPTTVDERSTQFEPGPKVTSNLTPQVSLPKKPHTSVEEPPKPTSDKPARFSFALPKKPPTPIKKKNL